jgi:hypothetical protein
MYLNPAHFNRFLAKMGQDCAWRRSHACPCRNARSGAADPKCPQCTGLGTYWDAAVACAVALSGQKVQAEWAKFGRWESGDQVVTLPSDSPAYALGQFDRLVMLQSSVPFSVILRPGDTLREPVDSVEQVSWFEGGALVSVQRPSSSGQCATFPASWLSGVQPEEPPRTWFGSTPPAEAQVTVSGRKRPEYFCLQEYPQDRAHHHGRPLPRRVVLRKFDLFGRGS